jgi:hypothetical protein
VEVEVEGHLLVEGLHRGGGAGGRRGGWERRAEKVLEFRAVACCRAWVGRKRASNLDDGGKLHGPSEPG